LKKKALCLQVYPTLRFKTFFSFAVAPICFASNTRASLAIALFGAGKKMSDKRNRINY